MRECGASSFGVQRPRQVSRTETQASHTERSVTAKPPSPATPPRVRTSEDRCAHGKDTRGPIKTRELAASLPQARAPSCRSSKPKVSSSASSMAATAGAKTGTGASRSCGTTSYLPAATTQHRAKRANSGDEEQAAAHSKERAFVGTNRDEETQARTSLCTSSIGLLDPGGPSHLAPACSLDLHNHPTRCLPRNLPGSHPARVSSNHETHDTRPMTRDVKSARLTLANDRMRGAAATHPGKKKTGRVGRERWQGSAEGDNNKERKEEIATQRGGRRDLIRAILPSPLPIRPTDHPLSLA